MDKIACDGQCPGEAPGSGLRQSGRNWAGACIAFSVGRCWPGVARQSRFNGLWGTAVVARCLVRGPRVRKADRQGPVLLQPDKGSGPRVWALRGWPGVVRYLSPSRVSQGPDVKASENRKQETC